MQTYSNSFGTFRTNVHRKIPNSCSRILNYSENREISVLHNNIPSNWWKFDCSDVRSNRIRILNHNNNELNSRALHFLIFYICRAGISRETSTLKGKLLADYVNQSQDFQGGVKVKFYVAGVLENFRSRSKEDYEIRWKWIWNSRQKPTAKRTSVTK